MRQFEIIDIGIRGKALCSFDSDILLVYYRGFFSVIFVNNKKVLNRFILPIPKWKRNACKIRLCERLLHVEPRWAIPIEDDTALIAYGNNIYSVNIYTGKFIKENLNVRGNPLTITHLEDITGFKDSYVVGDYGRNEKREDVHIYQRVEGAWNIVYTFRTGAIRHVHNIVPDKKNEQVFILTGDEDSESGIWVARNNFREVYPLFVGKQLYRACQILPLDDKIIYLTDAPSMPNSLNQIINHQVEKICEIEGSCIYGIVHGEYGFFSTTCEPDAKEKNRFKYWTTRKTGAGILNDKIHIFVVEHGEYLVVKTFESDKLPLRLFQYPTATFSGGSQLRQYFTPVCVKKYDMHIFEIIERNM